jgi:hypothetical protein
MKKRPRINILTRGNFSSSVCAHHPRPTTQQHLTQMGVERNMRWACSLLLLIKSAAGKTATALVVNSALLLLERVCLLHKAAWNMQIECIDGSRDALFAAVNNLRCINNEFSLESGVTCYLLSRCHVDHMQTHTHGGTYQPRAPQVYNAVYCNAWLPFINLPPAANQAGARSC